MSAALVALILIVLFLAFGIGLLGFALSVLWSLVWYAIVGLVIGGLARLLVSGRQDMGLLETALFGIAGSLLGGIIANDVLDVGWFLQFLT
ncbi:MAG: GlsB/YeaQ/YmgE family stress response membrane protein, partial [Gaiellales bacterium]